MKTARGLAIRRWKTYSRYQWDSIKLVIPDWIVALYIVVPALIFGVAAYWSWWNEPLSASALQLPLFVWLIPLLSLVFMGELRVWVEAADKLFLFQRQDWIRTLVRFGMMEFVLRKLTIIIFSMVVLLPWLVRGYAMPLSMIVMTALCTLSLSWLQALAEHWLRAHLHGWKYVLGKVMQIIVITLMFGLLIWFVQMDASGLFALAGMLVVLLLSMPLVRWRLRERASFEKDAAAESKQKGSLAQVVLSQAVEKTGRRNRKRPWLFRKSGYWKRLKHNSDDKLGPLAVKTLWRNKASLFFFIQLVGVGATAIVVTGLNEPVMLFGVIPFLVVLVSIWLHMYWKNLVTGEYWHLFQFRKEVLRKAAEHFVTVNAALGGLMWGITTGVVIGSGNLLIVCIAAVLGIVVLPLVGRAFLSLRGWSFERPGAKASV
ncbi:ABC transporter permease [Paenibacillus sp. SC116]|uniref:ABC transporter permease n=1 Tax=Paenibacillus sp. SC116 TaxID=2968986 RepID=UPI00215A8CFC|nr:ABC transporter permease [Paenibacillus sp. SC116]MCR8845207.1 ABC transporter permease [Paenibacillus sp. SC116]